MKKSRYILALALFISISFAVFPSAIPQKGTYQFHGAAGNEKVLMVRTANNASLEVVFGAGYVDVLETSFGPGALMVGAKKKSLVTAVDFDYSLNLTTFGLGVYDATRYVTDNWNWTLGDFSATPDLPNIAVTSLYNPINLTQIVNWFWAMNATIQNGAAYFAQLPTPVAQYLGAIVWEPRWQNVGTTVVHNALVGDFGINLDLSFFLYYHNCTETWTYDSTYGAWTGYKCAANGTTIYEFSIELPFIPGFEIPVLLGVTGFCTIGLVYIVMKKRQK
jgi:hypothetical protein